VSPFWRREPLHRRLAEQGGLADGLDLPTAAPASLSAEPPGFDGEARGETGIHGVPRRRRWDAVTTVEAPALRGDAVHFVALDDGTLVLDEDEPDGALEPLADAVEARLATPYRAEAVRRGSAEWAVAARSIQLVELKSQNGQEIELVGSREGHVLRIDGRTTLGGSPELERLGSARGTDYVVRARRVDGDVWEVETAAL
jgi:hypothetical protein